MTNKKLIDHCNSFWDIKGLCGDCPYLCSYCAMFRDKYSDTPLECDTRHGGKYYTDEEIEYEN